MDVPAEDKTDEEAEKLFRQAITIDPNYAEARVRLARLLERRTQYDEAVAQVEQALAAKPANTVAYFAHVVAGRTELARGHASDALGHYRAALAIFPAAQSALLGASQAAVINSDVPGALTLVQQLGEQTAVFDADPWWNYDLGAGRDVDDLMVALWARVSR
jgi:tetratricopeptide (TPR) repeat protein